MAPEETETIDATEEVAEAPKSAAELRKEALTARRDEIDAMTDLQLRRALRNALSTLGQRGSRPRPYSYRVESTANGETGEVIDLYAKVLGSTSEAIRDLLARGAASLAAERA